MNAVPQGVLNAAHIIRRQAWKKVRRPDTAAMLEVAAASLLAAYTAPELNTEWGIRHGDGDVLEGFHSREAVLEEIAATRRAIESGDLDADDYEPMSVVARRVLPAVRTGWAVPNPLDPTDLTVPPFERVSVIDFEATS